MVGLAVVVKSTTVSRRRCTVRSEKQKRHATPPRPCIHHGRPPLPTVVHEEVGAHGARRQVVDAAGPVGHVPEHHHRLHRGHEAVGIVWGGEGKVKGVGGDKRSLGIIHFKACNLAHAPLEDVGDDAGVHEQALRHLQRYAARLRLRGTFGSGRVRGSIP